MRKEADSKEDRVQATKDYCQGYEKGFVEGYNEGFKDGKLNHLDMVKNKEDRKEIQ